MIFFFLLPGYLKFHYDQTNYKLVDVDSIKSNVTIEYDLLRKIYSLDPIDAKSLGEFVGK